MSCSIETIELVNISLNFPTRGVIFSNINFTFKSGVFTLIKGASGSGKSSLLRLINGLQTPSEGKIIIQDKDLDQHEITHLRRHVSYMQQTPEMIEGTVKENLLLSFNFKSNTEPIPNDNFLTEKLVQYKLSHLDVNDSANELSGGEKQRLALIRILLTNPCFILCDEPTSALDEKSKNIMEEELKSLSSKKGIGILFITHNTIDLSNINNDCLELS